MCLNKNIIIGNGLIANTFKKYLLGDENIVIFASGVSNSSEDSVLKYEREKKLLYNSVNNYKKKRLIYFSTIAVFDPCLQNKEYIKFKKEIENYLLKIENCTVIRTSNIIGSGGNPNTLINYFMSSIRNNEKIVLWDNTERNFLGVDHLVQIALKYLLQNNPLPQINIIYPLSYSPLNILHEIENILKIKGNYKLVHEGKKYVPEISKEILKIIQELNIEISFDYLSHILKHYYRKDNIS